MKATNIVHWPDKDTAACDIHTAKLKNLAAILIGFLRVIPIFEDVECENCKNGR